MMEKIKQNWKIILVFSIFLIYLIAQHFLVFLYHDDFGYLSLSYEVNVGVSGTSFGFFDILKFLGLHYMHWGGRILGFFYEIFLCHIDLNVYRIFQSIVIMLIFLLIYLLGTKDSKEKDWKIALFTVSCYGIFEIMQMRSSFYWFTASCLYVIPMVFFFAFIYFYQKWKNKYDNLFQILLLAILIFLATFSQEQIAVGMFVYILLNTIVNTIQNKKLNKSDLIFCLSSLLAFLFLMLSPGTKARIGHEANQIFYNLSLLGKITKNIPEIVLGIFGNDNRYFTVLFMIVSVYCAYKNRNQKCGNQKINSIILIANIIMLLFQITYKQSYFGFMSELFMNHKFILSIICLLSVICLGYSYIIYFIQRKSWNNIYLIISAICSQGAMIVAPYFPSRSAIIFNLIVFVLVINILIHFLNETKFSIHYILIPFVIFCSLNALTIMKGYYKNVEVNKNNDLLLKEVSKKIKRGENIEEVHLTKLPDIVYASDQPYLEGWEYIYVWIKEYYDLPSSLIIKYQEEN